jgi:hypothetical protein
MSECSQSELLAEACANGFTCAGGNPTLAQALILQLLCNISAQGGAGVVFNNQAGAGSPLGTATPNYVGQFYVDTTAPYGVWFSVGMTNADWVQMY